MIRISGVGAAAAPAGPRKASRAGAGFRVDAAAAASGAEAAAPAAPVETLSALIALQSEAAGEGGGRGKAMAAARATLDLLDRLRLGLIEGHMSADDLEALAVAASRRADAAAIDSGLAGLHEEIALRARVELAKLGR